MTIEVVTTDRKEDFLTAIIAAEAMKELPGTVAAARRGLDAMGLPYELICITDGRDAPVMDALTDLMPGWPQLIVLGQRPWSGDDAALSVGLRRARGSLVLTMAGWPEVDPDELSRMPAALGDADMLSAVRMGQPLSKWQAWRRRVFNRFLSRLFDQSPADPFCRTRLGRKAIFEDVASFGVRQHFIPIIAGERGYRLAKIELNVAKGEVGKGPARYVFNPLGHVVAFLDALTLYVVLKFLRRPLRFFGSIGLPICLIGLIATAVLFAQKLLGSALADRPALIFAVLMIVLGIQIIAIGLVGEIIIFANSRRMKQYSVRGIIGRDAVTPSIEATGQFSPGHPQD